MPTVTNTRNHIQVFGSVRLERGNNTVTDDQLKTLQESQSFKRAQERGWVGIARDRGPEVTPGKQPAGRVQSETSPAQPDGSSVEPGTKPEVAPMDFPEANRASAERASPSKAPSRGR